MSELETIKTNLDSIEEQATTIYERRLFGEQLQPYITKAESAAKQIIQAMGVLKRSDELVIRSLLSSISRQFTTMYKDRLFGEEMQPHVVEVQKAIRQIHGLLLKIIPDEDEESN